MPKGAFRQLIRELLATVGVAVGTDTMCACSPRLTANRNRCEPRSAEGVIELSPRCSKAEPWVPGEIWPF